MIGQISIPAATAVVGYDLFGNQRWNISSKPRVIKGMAVTGGNAINEARLELFVEDKFIGDFYNTHSGAVAPITDDFISFGRGRFVPAGSKVSAMVAVAPTVSPINVILY